MSSQPESISLKIEPVPGYTPFVGVLVSTLSICRARTVSLVKDLSIPQLDYLMDLNANSIGALLEHITGLEALYQGLTLLEHNFDSTEWLQPWETALDLGEPARKEFKGKPASYYLEKMSAVRAVTLEQMGKVDDAWLWQTRELRPGAQANFYWQWYHVYEDEINHRGEISWMLSRIPQ